KLSYLEAIHQGLDQAMEKDNDVFVLGEDVGKKGGVFGVTLGLQQKYGEARVLDTPLAESNIRSEERRVGKEGRCGRSLWLSSRRRHTRSKRDWSSDVCSSDLKLSYLEAIHQGLDQAMEKDNDVFVLGEDVGKKGGVFGVTLGLQQKYGEARVLDTPLAESNI